MSQKINQRLNIENLTFKLSKELQTIIVVQQNNVQQVDAFLLTSSSVECRGLRMIDL